MDKQAGIKLSESVFVACKVCLTEIPMSEASSSEASDYVVYFCGLDCYEKWRKQDPNNDSEAL